MYKLSLFGSPSLERGGRPRHIPRRKARALLAYLAVTQQSYSREALVALLWPEYDHRNGRADLSRILSALRNILGADYFLTDRESVALNEESDLWVDVVHFRRQLDTCRAAAVAGLDDDCRQQLVAAVGLYQADFLAGFTLPDSPAFDEWQLLQTEALRRDLSWALDKLVHTRKARNDLAQAIAYAQRWVGLDPLHEPAQRRLIALYARNGQRAEAHRQYQACARLLAEELGVEPQPETKQLYEQIRKGGSKTLLIANRFQLLKKEDTLLGQGGIGEVYRGLDMKLDRPVAIKVARPDVIREHPELLERFVREGKALRQLDHPNIVKMIAAVVENDRHFLIMEYVSGGSLKDLLARYGLLPLPSALEIGLGLADALARAHHLNIIHRDIKPANVLLADDGTPRLTDFGLARLGDVSQLTLAGAMLGTVGYLSPEACQGETLDARSDIWSLGVLLVEMLTGEHPFGGNTPAATITAILNQPTPDLVRRYPHIPTPLANLIGQMLVKNRDERLPSMRLVGAELEAIQHGRSLTTAALPKKLEQEIRLPESRPEREHPFVARARELARLNSYLDEALSANGQVVFITGGAGRGKTSLLEEFARRAQKAHSDLIVAGGNGNTFAGAGDPFLPFREVMGHLTGDVATRRTGGQMGVEQARRLWALLPQATQAILDHGPQLLDVFVSGKQLLARVTAATPAGVGWLAALQTEVARRQAPPGAVEQTALFGQFTNVLHQLANKRPLLITLDDLQWIDQASIGLLFHLGRRLAGSRVLIVGAYRPDELSPGQNGEPHPLVQVLDEFKRAYGDVFIDLARADQVEGRAFIDAFLDTEPNRLDTAFRQALFQRTGGHPLFSVELLRDMQSRGDLVQDEAGRWCEGQELDWETFPARVEAVIARRVDRLDDTSRAILRVASVEGELFTAEVVARVLGMEERPLFHGLSDRLGKRHRLVRERGELKAGRGYLSSYQFSHALFQQYLYSQLSPGERRRLHSEVAGTLAALYADDLDQVVVQLALHYTAAADWNNAVTYRCRAGELAYQKASLPDAARHYQSALAHWPKSDKVGRAQTLCKLGECLWILGQQLKAVETLQASYDLSHRAGDNQRAGAALRLLGRIYWELGEQDKASDSHRQALAILEREPESEELAWALAGMSNYYMHLGDYDESINFGERALALARRLGADVIIIQSLCDLGSALSSKGDWDGVAMEQESLARALALNRPHDAGRAYLYIGEALIYLGRYEQARDTLEDALAYTRRMHVPYIAEAASRMLVEVDWLTGRWSAAITQLQPMVDQAGSEQPGSLSQLYLGVVHGRLYNDLGQAEKAHKLLAEAMAGPVNTLDPRVALLGELARAEAILDRPAAVASAATEILEWTDQASYLFPNVGMALVLICRLPVAFGWPAMVGSAHFAWQQLERLDRQYGTPATAACRLEGQGWLTLAEADAAKAAAYFKQAGVQWQDLGHSYDHARALSGLGRALTLSGDKDGAKSAAKQAMGLVESLAAQLEDPALKASFLDSVLVREIRAIMVGS